MLDPQVSPEEIKSREVELGLRVGLLSLQLFPNGGATDVVFMTVLHSSSLGQQLRGAVVHGSLNGLPRWRLFRGFTLLSPFSHSSPSLTGLLASVDVKQQSLSSWRWLTVSSVFAGRSK